MKECRKYERFTVDAIEINSAMILAADVRIIDMGLGGISIKTDRRLNIGTEYPLKFMDKSKFLSLKGTVIWSSLIESRGTESGARIPIYQAGIKFTALSEGEAHELLSFIERNNVHELAVPKGARLNVRFRIKAQDEAILYCHEQYKVRQLSLGGMRIDSNHSMEIDSKLPMEIFPSGDSPICFIGRVTSCREVNRNSPNSYAVGIEFLDLTEGDRKVLANLIASCEVLDDDVSSERKTLESVGEQMPVVPKKFAEKVDYLYVWHKNMGYYRVLGVSEYASDTEIKDMYLKMAKKIHPDKYFNCSEEMKEKLHALSSYLNAAYSTLTDPVKRKEYDKTYKLTMKGSVFFVPED